METFNRPHLQCRSAPHQETDAALFTALGEPLCPEIFHGRIPETFTRFLNPPNFTSHPILPQKDTMAGPGQRNKKRAMDARLPRPAKKQKRRQEYHSESEAEEEIEFNAVDLLDSDDDIHNARVHDVGGSADDLSSSDEDRPALKKLKKPKKATKSDKQKKQAPEEPESDDEEADEDDDEEDEEDAESKGKKSKSKRNDPSAFATSLSKILSTKLSTSKRSDPVLARSAEAHQASKAAVDTALEAKARKQLRDQKRLAMEKGRVKDVLIATTSETTGELEGSTSEIMVTERRLRKVAQRGVVKLFNAVRAAQVKAVETDKSTRKAGVIGMNRREEKVNEMTKKGFLELIASGGGGLKKGGLEEA